MNIYKILSCCIVVFFLGLLSCQNDTNVNGSACSEYPEEVINQQMQILFDEAKWQLYKFNLIEGDGFDVDNPLYRDSVYKETSLAEFELDFHKISWNKDTVNFYFLFERGVSPDSHPYYVAASFWDDETSFGLNLYERFGFIHKRSDFNKEFDEYLTKHKSKLSTFLTCQAKEKGVTLNTD